MIDVTKPYFEIVSGDFGATYEATVEDVNYSSYTATIWVWNKDETPIISGGTCTTEYTSGDTVVSYVVQPGDFAVSAGLYYGVFRFKTTNFAERTLPFAWRVYDQGSSVISTTSTTTTTTTTTTTSTSTSTTTSTTTSTSTTAPP